MPSRFRFSMAQLGRKPGAKRSLAVLPVPSDLPGEGWKVLDERTWRTGSMGNEAEWGRRAKEAESVTAWRSFEQTGAERWLWVEALPLASADDAVLALRDIPDLMLKNSQAEVTLTGEREVDGLDLPGAATVWGYEQMTSGVRGDGTARFVGGTVGPSVLVVCGSGLTNEWPWDDLLQVARTIVERIGES